MQNLLNLRTHWLMLGALINYTSYVLINEVFTVILINNQVLRITKIAVKTADVKNGHI